MVRFRFRVLIDIKGLETVFISASSVTEAIKKFNLLFYSQKVTVVDIQETKDKT